jgi:hypothetical protein
MDGNGLEFVSIQHGVKFTVQVTKGRGDQVSKLGLGKRRLQNPTMVLPDLTIREEYPIAEYEL